MKIDNNVLTSRSPRGQELFLIGNAVRACGRPLYAHPDYQVQENSVYSKILLTTVGDRDFVWANNRKILCYKRIMENRELRYLEAWGKLEVPALKSIWEYDCPKSAAVAVCSNAVVVTMSDKVVALSITDGKELWTQPLPSTPISWGLAVNRAGNAVITLKNGQVLCLGMPGD